MAGKRYKKDEIELIVSMKNSGSSFSDIKTKIKEQFGYDRPERALKIIYNRYNKAAN